MPQRGWQGNAGGIGFAPLAGSSGRDGYLGQHVDLVRRYERLDRRGVPANSPADPGVAVIGAVALFHIPFAWNDHFVPLTYALGQPELQPVSVGIQQFDFAYAQQPHLIQATALLGMAVPVLLSFRSQRDDMRGVVITGVDE